MRCEQAIHMLDAYLDGELSSSLATEVNAHCLRCRDCGRALALAQVAESVISSDCLAPVVREDFTDRLLACLKPVPRLRRLPWRRGIYIGAPIAAAAVVAFAFLGFFEPPTPTMVLGKLETGVPKPAATVGDVFDGSMDLIIERATDNLNTKFDSGLTLKGTFDRRLWEVMDLFSAALLNASEAPQPIDCDEEADGKRPDDAALDPDVEDL